MEIFQLVLLTLQRVGELINALHICKKIDHSLIQATSKESSFEEIVFYQKISWLHKTINS